MDAHAGARLGGGDGVLRRARLARHSYKGHACLPASLQNCCVLRPFPLPLSAMVGERTHQRKAAALVPPAAAGAVCLLAGPCRLPASGHRCCSRASL